MYKDKDKQREAQRDWVRQKRAVKGSTEQGSTVTKADSHVDASDIGIVKALHASVIPCDARLKVIPENTPVVILCETDSTDEYKPKRGKDIKTFKDLPPDVQQTIDEMSVVDGKIDQTIKVNRTAIAVNYQRLFPGRYYPVSTYHYPQDAAVTGKPGVQIPL